MSSRDITLFFENRRLPARSGESIASALYRAGVRTLSYSVKYKRPRGIHCGRGRCVMCHMEVDGVPGVPTCITPVRDGMRVRREDFRPFFAPLLILAVRWLRFPAGFYYRLFTRPALLQKLFMATLRRMAGVGRLRADGRRADVAPVSSASRKTRVAPRYDVGVIGAGLAGLAAAVSAADRGASVLLVDEYPRAGGHSMGFQSDRQASSVRDELIAKMRGHRAIDYSPRTTAQAFYPPATLLLGPGGAVGPELGTGRAAAGDDSERIGSSVLQRVNASAFVFATGAYDVVPLFDNNDTPGIFGVRALRLFIERDRLVPGSRAVVYGSGLELDHCTRYLMHHGIELAATVDPAHEATGNALPENVRQYSGSVIVRANGGRWLSSVTIARGPQATGGTSRGERIPCDLLCAAFPGQGAYELAYQAGFQFKLSRASLREERVMLPTRHELTSEDGTRFFVVGELAGQRSWRDKTEGGRRAAAMATAPQQSSRKD